MVNLRGGKDTGTPSDTEDTVERQATASQPQNTQPAPPPQDRNQQTAPITGQGLMQNNPQPDRDNTPLGTPPSPRNTHTDNLPRTMEETQRQGQGISVDTVTTLHRKHELEKEDMRQELDTLKKRLTQEQTRTMQLQEKEKQQRTIQGQIEQDLAILRTKNDTLNAQGTQLEHKLIKERQEADNLRQEVNTIRTTRLTPQPVQSQPNQDTERRNSTRSADIIDTVTRQMTDLQTEDRTSITGRSEINSDTPTEAYNTHYSEATEGLTQSATMRPYSRSPPPYHSPTVQTNCTLKPTVSNQPAGISTLQPDDLLAIAEAIRPQTCGAAALNEMRKYDGTDPAKLENFFSDVENVQRLTKGSHLDIAFAKTTSAARDALAKCTDVTKIWEEIKELMKNQLGDTYTSNSALTELQMFRQEANEPLSVYNHRLWKTIRRAQAEDQEERNIVVYLSGIRNRDLAYEIRRQKPTTLDHAMKTAREILSAMKDVGKDTSTKTINMMSGHASNSGSENEHGNCYQCNRYGHWAIDCPRSCSYCDQQGHTGRECTNIPCTLCNLTGHKAAYCENVPCFNCKEKGHLAVNCPHPRTGPRHPTCHNCNAPGHIARNCPERDLPTCYKCHNKGHMARECPQNSCTNCGSTSHSELDCRDERRIPPSGTPTQARYPYQDNRSRSMERRPFVRRNTPFPRERTPSRGRSPYRSNPRDRSYPGRDSRSRSQSTGRPSYRRNESRPRYSEQQGGYRRDSRGRTPSGDRRSYGPRSDSRDRRSYGPRSDSRDRRSYGPRSDSRDRRSYGPRSDSRDRRPYRPREDSRDRRTFTPREDSRSRGPYRQREESREGRSYRPPRDDTPRRERSEERERPRRPNIKTEGRGGSTKRVTIYEGEATDYSESDYSEEDHLNY